MAAVQEGTNSEDRLVNVSNALGLDKVELPQEGCDQLRALVAEFLELFALELGRTSTVTHVINTGESSPVRQYLVECHSL